MIRSTIIPRICGEFVRWITRETFIASVDGVEIVCHRNFWTGDFPAYVEADVKPNA